MSMGGRISQRVKCKSGYSLVDTKYGQVMIEPGTDAMMAMQIGDDSGAIWITSTAKVRIRMQAADALRHFEIEHDEEPVL